MTRKHGVMAFVAAAAMLATLAAQAQPPGGGRGRGAGGCPGGGMIMGPGMGLLQLLRIQDVQDELQMTPEQKDKLRDLAPARAGAGARLQDMQDLPAEERRAKMAELAKEMQERSEKQLAEILKPDQIKRLKEIGLQAAEATMGLANALLSPDVTKALELTSEQIDKLQEIQRSLGEARRGLGLGRDATPEERREKTAPLLKESSEKALQVLTAQQKETWQKLQGKKLDVDYSALMQRGGGRDGSGRRRGGQ